VTLLQAIALGVLQGITEFLPISSSAHLILARAFFGWDAAVFGLAFDVACHVGTLIAVVAYFWRDLAGIARALARPLASDRSGFVPQLADHFLECPLLRALDRSGVLIRGEPQGRVVCDTDKLLFQFGELAENLSE